jgi:N-acetylglucosamine kinase-like BadF-type ATPase
MSFFLALDAGGTKTDYVLADETRELARVRTGTIKRMRTDAETAAFNLDSGLRQLTALSGVTMQSASGLLNGIGVDVDTEGANGGGAWQGSKLLFFHLNLRLRS